MSGENSAVRIKCYKCGNSYTTDMMRYDPDRPARLVCRNCLTKKDGKGPGESGTSGKAAPKADSGMVKYYCIKCHYKFERRRDLSISACPYCGSDTLTTKTDASSILRKAEDEEFEM
jgi:DNA-directed RNA polymerase subunit RPC12/RpoP